LNVDFDPVGWIEFEFSISIFSCVKNELIWHARFVVDEQVYFLAVFHAQLLTEWKVVEKLGQFDFCLLMCFSAFTKFLLEIYDLLSLVKRPKAIPTIRTVVSQFEFILALGPVVCSAALTLHIPCLSRIF
jgi:hypothetical protein